MAEGYKRLHHRKGRMSASEIMTILLCYHFGTFRNFKHYYLYFIKGHLASCFPTAVSYNRFVEFMPRVFFQLMAFMKYAFGRYSGISFVDSTMIPVYHNVRRHLTRSFPVFSRAERGLWGGVMALSCTYCATTWMT